MKAASLFKFVWDFSGHQAPQGWTSNDCFCFRLLFLFQICIPGISLIVLCMRICCCSGTDFRYSWLCLLAFLLEHKLIRGDYSCYPESSQSLSLNLAHLSQRNCNFITLLIIQNELLVWKVKHNLCTFIYFIF